MLKSITLDQQIAPYQNILALMTISVAAGTIDKDGKPIEDK